MWILCRLQACIHIGCWQLQRSAPPASLAPSSNLPALMRALFSMTTRSSWPVSRKRSIFLATASGRFCTQPTQLAEAPIPAYYARPGLQQHQWVCMSWARLSASATRPGHVIAWLPCSCTHDKDRYVQHPVLVLVGSCDCGKLASEAFTCHAAPANQSI